MSSAEPWFKLVSRYGKGTQSPTEAHLIAALRELFHEDHPNLTESDYAEHPDAWTTLGYDDGPVTQVTITRTGTARFEEWADADYDVPRGEPIERKGVSETLALRLWKSLSAGDVDQVRTALLALP